MRIDDTTPLEEVMRSPDDERLEFLLQFGMMAKNMAGKQGQRQKQFTRDTGLALHHTCFGIVDLVRYLLKEKKFMYWDCFYNLIPY